MARKFPDWLSAYFDYAQDDMCPAPFHFWTGVSVLAAAMERKLWATRGHWTWFPNLYVMLVSDPSKGKSSASSVGQHFLSGLGTDMGTKLRFTANQMSEPSLLKQLSESGKKIIMPDGTQYEHSSAYFYASECSASMAEVSGKLPNTLNAMYDCPPSFNKGLVGRPGEQLKNVCVNMLVGCTFSFLEELLPQAIVGNGFASRIIYVVADREWIRSPDPEPPPRSSTLFQDLMGDLAQIYELRGRFRKTDGWNRRWSAAVTTSDIRVRDTKSARMRDFIGRHVTNTVKLSMVFALSEGNDLVLEERHWERAAKEMAKLEKNLPDITSSTASRDNSKGITHHILRTLQQRGNNGVLAREKLFSELLSLNVDTQKLDHTVRMLEMAQLIVSVTDAITGHKGMRLNANPDDYI